MPALFAAVRRKRGLRLLDRIVRCRSLALVALAWSALALAQTGGSPRFDIDRFVVEGNRSLSQSEIDGAVSAFAGRDRDFNDVLKAAEALQAAYAAHGFTVRVYVPEQDVRAGEVRLQVIEARLRRILVQGNRFFSDGNVRASLPSLKPGTAPDARAIAQDAQLANDNPAKQTAVALERGQEPGDVDARVRVADEDPGRVSLSLDNTGTPQTGRSRAGLGYQHANVLGRDHVFNAQYITSPSHAGDVRIYGAGYRVPFYETHGTVDVFAGHSDVNSGTVQNLFNVSGKGSIFGLRYTQLLPKPGLYDQRVALGWDYRAFQQNVVLIGTSETLVPDITVRPLSLSYSGRYSQVGRDASVFAAWSRNIPGGANGDQAAFDAQRPGADSRYSIWRYGMSLVEALPADFLVRAALSGQSTGDRLVPGEQFGMGGVDSVRGYFERETANDVGHRASLEGHTPDFGGRLAAGWRARALVFTDFAGGHDVAPARGPDSRLRSAGIGVRANRDRSLSLRVEWARVLEAAGSRREGDHRVHFAVAYSF
jgi:hemolysin activation/secretion protein